MGSTTAGILIEEERFALIQVKIERAKKHIINLKGEIDGFLAAHPYGVVEEIDSELGKMRYVIDRVSPIPQPIMSIAGDAIQNLRTALDYLAFQLLLVRRGVSTSNEHMKFPIADTPQEYKAILERKIQRRLRQDAVDALYKAEAHKGGDGHDIWVLNRLNNIDKHRILISNGSASRSVNLGAAMLRHAASHFGDVWRNAPQLDAFFRPADNLCPLEVGDELVTNMPLDMKFDTQKDFRFDIAFNEPEICEGKPVIETLQHFTDLVSNTVVLFKPCLS